MLIFIVGERGEVLGPERQRQLSANGATTDHLGFRLDCPRLTRGALLHLYWNGACLFRAVIDVPGREVSAGPNNSTAGRQGDGQIGMATTTTLIDADRCCWSFTSGVAKVSAGNGYTRADHGGSVLAPGVQCRRHA